MPTLLPKDADNNVIPALRLRGSGGAHTIAATATTARNSTAFNAETRVDAGTSINFVISEGPAMPDYGDDATTSGGEPQP